jgi:Putative cell wall-binding domain
MKNAKNAKKALAAIALVGLTLTMVPFNAFAADTVSTRLAGATAVQASQAVAENGWLYSSKSAVLAPDSSDNLIEALAAAPLAAALKAPILLTGGEQLSAEAKTELKRLGVKTVYLTSGPTALKEGVIAELKGMGLAVTNLGGADPYETSVNIAKEISKVNPIKTIFLANGETPSLAQDAFSAASVAGVQKQPLLLTQNGQLPKVVSDYIASIKANVTSSYITGGTGVISEEIKAQLPGTVYRNAGENAYDTNLEVLKNSTSYNYSRVFVANGETMLDALAGTSLAAQTSSPIVLVNSSENKAAADFLKTKLRFSSVVTALGGESEVPEVIRAALANPAELNIEKVEGTTTTVYADKKDQVLGISVNGAEMSIDELASAGYQVLFQASKKVFPGDDNESNTGIILKDLDEDTNFNYVVNLLKGDVIVATSDSKRVKVKARENGSSAIDEAKIYLENSDGSRDNMAQIKSGIITTEDTALLKVLGNLANDNYGAVTGKMNYYSSDPSIAFVDKDSNDSDYLAIKTGGSTGPVTITIMASDGTRYTLNLKVVDEKRHPDASKIWVSSTDVKLCTGASTGVCIIVNDQFGDPVKGEALVTTKPANTDGTLAMVTPDGFRDGAYGDGGAYWIFDPTSHVTDRKGRAFIVVAAVQDSPETATFRIKDENDNTLKTINYTGQSASTTVNYKLNLQPFTTPLLDASDADASHTFVKFDSYNSNGFKTGTITLDDVNMPGEKQDHTKKYTIKVDNSTDASDYITLKYVASIVGPRLDITSGKRVKATPVKVSVYEGDIECASFQVIPGDTRVGIEGVKFAKKRTTIRSTARYKLSDFIAKEDIKTADGSPVYLETSPNENNLVYIEGIDGTILGEIRASVIEGDLEVGMDQDYLTVTSSSDEDGKLALKVNKLNGGIDAKKATTSFYSERIAKTLDIPGSSHIVGSMTINVVN